MYRLMVPTLAILAIISSIFLPVVARETNADRLRRGYPPLPPGRRNTVKRSGPSPSPSPSPSPVSTPQSVSGVLEVRDKAGSHRLGFVSNEVFDVHTITFLAVADPKQPASQRLQVNLSLVDRNLAAINPVFLRPIPIPPPPKCVGPPGPGPDPGPEAFSSFPLTIIHCPIPPLRGPWVFDPTIVEVKVTLPGPKGDPVPAFFEWDPSVNALGVVPALVHDKRVRPVRLFLANQ